MKKINSLLLISLVAFGCAKERPIERLQHPNTEWQTKNTFTSIKSNGQPNKWYYKTTIVKTSNNSGFGFVGSEGPMRLGYFNFTKEKLQFLDSLTNFRGSSNNTATLINQWDIAHHDLMLQESGGKVRPVETEDNRKIWSNKKYFSIDFSKSNISDATRFGGVNSALNSGCWSPKASSMVEDSLKVSGDYITFVVSVNYELNPACNSSVLRAMRDDYTYSVDFRHSFKRYVANPGYKPLEYTQGEQDQRMKKYGYFQTVLTHLDPVTGEYRNNFYVNRWDPKKTHNYYFAKGFPQEWKWIFNDPEKGIFAKTNKIFEQAGLPTRFYVRENTWGDGLEKNLGDLRYSFINIIEESSSSAPLGYGPSSTNPYTGEIISANISLFTSSLRYYVEILKKMDEELKEGNSSLQENMLQFLKVGSMDNVTGVLDMSVSDDVSNSIHGILRENTYGAPFWNMYTRSKTSNSIFKSRFNEVKELANKTSNLELLNSLDLKDEQIVEEHFNKLSKNLQEAKHTHSSCNFSAFDAALGANGLLVEGKDPEQIITNILYTTAIHEFGHTLNLRHNFYGSVDSKNFAKPQGDEKFVAASSSVMDYLALQEEVDAAHRWGDYDKAAIKYAYSDMRIDDSKEKNFLFCTDEHRPLNPLCNVWDAGDSPSKILLDKIKKYDMSYKLRNYRNDRAFWNTTGYASGIFQTMYEIKSFIGLWADTFNGYKVEKYLTENTTSDEHQKTEMALILNQEMINTTKLAIAFYHSVIQQSSSDRDWSDSTYNFSGAKERIGILYDKLFAMRFLIGDEAIMNDPNNSTRTSSYLGLIDHPQLGPLVSEVFENAVTSRIDMDNWFLGYGRNLFAINAMNFSNRSNTNLIDKIKVIKLSPFEMEQYLELKDFENLNEIKNIELTQIKSTKTSVFNRGEDVAVANIRGDYYIASKANSPFAYTIFQSIYEDKDNGSVSDKKYELLDMYRAYRVLTNGAL